MSSQYLDQPKIQTRQTYLPSYLSHGEVNKTISFDYIPSTEAFLQSALEIPVCTVLPFQPASRSSYGSSRNSPQMFVIFCFTISRNCFVYLFLLRDEQPIYGLPISDLHVIQEPINENLVNRQKIRIVAGYPSVPDLPTPLLASHSLPLISNMVTLPIEYVFFFALWSCYI